MTDEKARIKAMIGHIIDKNDDKAASEFHTYLAAKMRGAMQDIPSHVDIPSNE